MTATAFDNLDDYLALPRVSGLAVSADGRRVVTTVATLNDTRSEHISAVWELDVAGQRPARRLTRSANGDPSGPPSGDGPHLWQAKWWTQGSEPGWTAQWADLGRC